MTDNTQRRMWAYLPLPVDLKDIGDLSKWMVIDGDPVALLEECLPFLGDRRQGEGLRERIEQLIATAPPGGER